MDNTAPSADARSFTVVVDFGNGTITGLQGLMASVVEYVEEDMVTAGDDVARCCAETLAHYASYGDVEPKYASLLHDALQPYRDQ